MYGIFTYIWLNLVVNVGKYTIHGCYGICGSPLMPKTLSRPMQGGFLGWVLLVDDGFMIGCFFVWIFCWENMVSTNPLLTVYFTHPFSICKSVSLRLMYVPNSVMNFAEVC